MASHGTTSAVGVRAFRYLTVFRYAILGRAGGAAPPTPTDSLARITRACAGELCALWGELLAEQPDQASAELGAMSGSAAPTGPSFSTLELEDADYIDPLVYGDGQQPVGM